MIDYFDDDDLDDEGPDSEERDPAFGLDDQSSYICHSCGQEISIALDLSAGSEQRYVEDCPVCCQPNVIVVSVSPDGQASVSSESEQDLH